MIGALDMGGSSNQLVIYNASESSEKVQSTDFWSHSWLHYGVERIRERVLHYMRTLHQQGPDEADDATVAASMLDLDNDPSIGTNTVNINNASNYEELVDAVVGRIPNPCSLVDSEDLYNGKWIFHGTGDAQKCLDIIEKVVWPQRNELVEVEIGMDGTVDEQTCTTPPCAVNSVIHPSVVGHEFYAMSVYFYALDFIRSFGPHPLPNWYVNRT